MSEPSTKVCTLCGGAGKTRVNEDTWKPCYCSFARMFKAKVGPEIAFARVLKSSPLFMPPTDTSPAVDLTKENVHITGFWHDVLAHIRFALVFKNLEYDLHYYMRIATDERLKAVYLGEMSYKTKSKRERDSETAVSYNTLADYIGPDLHLVVIQLGVISYPNKALPGILKEALLIRQAAGKPTWIVDSPECPWGPGHFAYDDDVCDHVGRYFTPVNLTQLKPGQVIQPKTQTQALYESEDGMSTDRDDVPDPDDAEEPQQPAPRPKPERPMTSTDKRNFVKDHGLDLVSDDGDRKKKRGGKGGGGPL